MKRNPKNSLALPNAPRCAFTSAHHHRCRMPVASPDSRYCAAHWQREKIDADSLASELSEAAGALDAPQDVLRVLSKVFLAASQNRITPRKAAVLGYLGQMLLRAHREIAYHQKIQAENSDTYADYFDVPRPIRDDPAPAPQLPASEATAASSQPSTTPSESSAASSSSSSTDAKQQESLSAGGSQNAHSPASSADSSSANPARAAAAPAFPPPVVPPPDLRHFYPFDPSLPPGYQDPWSSIPPEYRPGGSRHSRGRYRRHCDRIGSPSPW